MKKKKFKQAYNKFKKATKENPKNHAVWYFKAKALYDHIDGYNKRMDYKKYVEANNDIDKALELNLNNSDAWITKSNILKYIGNYEDSLKCCYEALKIKPNAFWIDTAFIHEWFKHYQEAIECIEKAIINRDPKWKLISLEMLKSALQTALKYGKNYYFPVTRVGLLSILPPKSEILYSTLMRIRYAIKIDRHGKAHWANLYTPVYFTSDGFSCLFPVRLYGYNQPMLISWKDVRFAVKGNFKVGPHGVRGFSFKLLITKFRESQSDFKIREEEFNDFIRKIRGEKHGAYPFLEEKINREIEEIIISFLKSKSGNAFTLASLKKKINSLIMDADTFEYFKKNAERVFNNLINNKKVKSTLQNNEVLYFI